MIRIHTTLTSDTPHLPELAPLVGRRVSITVEEETTTAPLPPYVTPGTGDWDAAERAADFLSRSTYNWDTLAEQDAVDIADQERNRR